MVKFFVIVVFASMGCSRTSHVNFEVSKESDGVKFDFSGSRVASLLGCLLWVEGKDEILWNVRLNHFDGRTLIYGDTSKHFRQILPSEGLPKQLPRDQKIYLLVEYQDDYLLRAGGGHQLFAFKVVGDGTAINLGSQEYVQPPFH